MKKRLSLEKPKIMSYLHHAYPLAIMSNHENFLPWFYNNYIQLYCNKNSSDSILPVNFYRYLDWSYYPLLDHQFLSRDLIPNLNIIDYVIHVLESDYYFYAYVNELYVPGRKAYQKYDFDHELLISGYDDINRTFIATSFIKGEYSDFEISFEEFEKAFANMTCSFEFMKLIRVIKPNVSNTHHFDPNAVMESLKDYLNSCSGNDRFTNQNYFNSKKIVFGMDVYSEIQSFIPRIKSEQLKPEINPFQILWEHKVIMQERFQYLLSQLSNPAAIEQLTIISTSYDRVVQKSDRIRLLILMYQKTKRESLLHNVLNELEQLEQLERDTITNWIDKHEKYAAEEEL